jgi:hypothetical protein
LYGRKVFESQIHCAYVVAEDYDVDVVPSEDDVVDVADAASIAVKFMHSS